VQASEGGIFASLTLPSVGSSFSSLDLTVPSSAFNLSLAVPDGAQSYTVGVDDLGLTQGAAVPEPSITALLVSGLPFLALALYAMRRRTAGDPRPAH
jgi:hypothetical protein